METKVWGKKDTIFRGNNVVIDILYLKKDTFCSWHYHNTKYNKFIVLSGKVRIEFLDKLEMAVLENGSNSDYLFVNPLKKHRFVVLEDSVVIEIMYTTNNQQLCEDDIVRSKQGGKIINGQEIRECDLGDKK